MIKTVILHSDVYRDIDVTSDNVWDFIERIRADDGAILGYRVLDNIAYFSRRYGKYIGVEKGDRSDGATGAKDLDSFGWIFHDEMCVDGTFEIGVKCTNWQASHVLTDIMKLEGYWFRTRTWFWSTWFLGGGKARKNGMI